MLGLVLAGLGYWGWQRVFPNDDRLIRNLLRELAEAATIQVDEAPLTRVSNTGRLSALFTEDLEVRVEVGNRSVMIRGKDDLFKTVLAARGNYAPVRVEFLDARIERGADRQLAMVLVAARIHGALSEDASFQELRMTLAKSGRKWRVQRVETFRSVTL